MKLFQGREDEKQWYQGGKNILREFGEISNEDRSLKKMVVMKSGANDFDY